MDTDEDLVRGALAAPEGDTRDFETLVRRHQASIVANARFLTRAPDDAEDLAQEVFIKVFFKLQAFEGRSSFRTWLQRIKANHCFSYLKRKKGKRMEDILNEGLAGEAPLIVEPSVHAKLDAEAERSRIREVLESMPDGLRVPLVLCDVDGLSYQEIADALGLGLSAIKMRISRGRREFRRRYLDAAPATGGAG